MTNTGKTLFWSSQQGTRLTVQKIAIKWL